MRATEDGIRPRQMKDELHAWGKKWKGTNFADNVSEAWKLCDEDPARFFRQTERVCKLDRKNERSDSEFFSSDGRFNSAATASVATADVVWLGRRGGSTEPLKGELETSTKRYRYSPNSVSNVDVEEIHGEDPAVWTSFTCTSPREMGPIPFYVFSILVVFVSTVSISYLQQRRYRNSQNW